MRALSFSLLALSFLGAGCFSSNSKTVVDGGIYQTTNLQGGAWTQLSTLFSNQKIGSIANVGVASFEVDPQDTQALYLGTTQNGMLYSLDGGASWQVMKDVASGQVNAIVVAPDDKCTVYAARANQLLKTETCGRDWAQAYFDNRVNQVITTVAVNPQNARVIFMGNLDGDIMRSDDGGVSWRVVYREDGVRINDIQIDPRDAKIMYVATNGAGILKSTDGGSSWKAIRDVIDSYDNARRPLKVVLDPQEPNVIFHVSRTGILRSTDGGSSFQPIATLSPSNATNIRSFAVHPKNNKQLVYATDTAIVYSGDLGATWTSKKLPTSRLVSFLEYGPGTGNPLYLGTTPRR